LGAAGVPWGLFLAMWVPATALSVGLILSIGHGTSVTTAFAYALSLPAGLAVGNAWYRWQARNRRQQ
jgi:hypothetical protein